MYGAFAGDIIGSVYEFDNIKTKQFPLFTEESSYTDDSIMSAAIARAMLKVKKKGVCAADACIESMRAYARKYPCPVGGYGSRFYRWLCSRDPQPYNSYGNGSAMRVSACGIIAGSLDEALALSKDSAAVTHNHPDGISGAQATAAAIYLARIGSSKEEIKQYIEENFYALPASLESIRPDYRFHVSCRMTVPQAVLAFYESVSFEDAIRNAVSLGGDSDTLAAICGSIAWEYYGRDYYTGKSSTLPEDMARIKEEIIKRVPKDFSAAAEELYRMSRAAKSKHAATELVFILDESGSMSCLAEDTVGGFNTLLAEKKAAEGEVYVTTVLFNTRYRRLHDRVDISTLSLLQQEDYKPCGGTALLDAVGSTIKHIADIHRYARPEDVPAHTIFVITTDGMENASHRYTLSEVREMIEHERSKYGWEFLFLGANIDAEDFAGDIGIPSSRAANYTYDSKGARLAFSSIGTGIKAAYCCSLDSSGWADELRADYAARGKKRK